MKYKNLKYDNKYQNKYKPKINHYIPNDYPPYFADDSIFKTEQWGKIYIFTITGRNKIPKYKTYVYKVDLEIYEQSNEIIIDSLGAQTIYHAWSMYGEDPRYIQNIKSLGTISHGALLGLKKEEITDFDYAKFFLVKDLVRVEV